MGNFNNKENSFYCSFDLGYEATQKIHWNIILLFSTVTGSG